MRFPQLPSDYIAIPGGDLLASLALACGPIPTWTLVPSGVSASGAICIATARKAGPASNLGERRRAFGINGKSIPPSGMAQVVFIVFQQCGMEYRASDRK
jgi:hypothetical protein